MKKTFKVVFILGGLALAIPSFAQNENSYKLIPLPGKCYGISPNGNWVISTENTATAYLYDDSTGEVVNLLTTDITFCEAHAVGNDGTVVGIASGMPGYYKDGQWYILEMPKGYSEGQARHISEDGSVIYGFVNQGFYYKPVVWRNNVIEYPEVPSRDLFNKIPQGGFMLFQATDNEEVMIGRMMDAEYAWYPMIWKDGKADVMVRDLFIDSAGKSTNAQVRSMSMSNNGKYVSLNILTSASGNMSQDYSLYVYNIENDILTEIEGDLITQVDNNGRAYFCMEPVGGLARHCFVNEDGVSSSLEDWVLRNYNIDLVKDHGVEYSGTPMGLSADGKSMAGFCIANGTFENFLLHMGTSTSIQENQKPAPVVIARKSTIEISEAMGAQITIADIAGRIVFNKTLPTSSYNINVTPGTYIIQVVNEGESYSFKTIVHN